MSDTREAVVYIPPDGDWTSTKPCLACRWVENTRICDSHRRFVRGMRCEKHSFECGPRGLDGPRGSDAATLAFTAATPSWALYGLRKQDHLPGEPDTLPKMSDRYEGDCGENCDCPKPPPDRSWVTTETLRDGWGKPVPVGATMTQEKFSRGGYIPRLQTPRITLESHPDYLTARWNHVPGATRYELYANPGPTLDEKKPPVYKDAQSPVMLWGHHGELWSVGVRAIADNNGAGDPVYPRTRKSLTIKSRKAIYLTAPLLSLLLCLMVYAVGPAIVLGAGFAMLAAAIYHSKESHGASKD